jgi:hypothetical protein
MPTLAQAIRQNLVQAAEHTYGSCVVEFEGREVSFRWRDGVATVEDGETERRFRIEVVEE